MRVSTTRKGFYMFSRDLLSSRRYRCCSWVAKGIYFDLLNVLALQPKPGAISLSDFDLKPKNERSLTFRCLQCQKKAKNGEYQSIKYFAEAIAVSGASGPRPGLIHGLQELYLRGMIIIEGETLIQPRMYIDNGYELTVDNDQTEETGEENTVAVGSPDDSDSDPDAERLRTDGKDGKKGSKNNIKNNSKNPRVGAGDAPAQSESASKSKNIDNDNGNIGGMGGDAPDDGKTEEKSPDGKNGASGGAKKPGMQNTPPAKEKPAKSPQKGKNKPSVADNPPTLEEIQAYFDERAQQGKPFLYVTADGFYDACCQSGWTLKDGKPMIDWRARVRTFESFRKEHGDRPVAQWQGGGQSATPPKPGNPVPATKPKPRKYKDKW